MHIVPVYVRHDIMHRAAKTFALMCYGCGEVFIRSVQCGGSGGMPSTNRHTSLQPLGKINLHSRPLTACSCSPDAVLIKHSPLFV